jgi:hypothetical protein
MNRVILIFILLAFATGCTKGKNNTCQSCSVPVSFSMDIIPIFTTNCAITGSPCHASGSNSGGLGLDSAVAYAQSTDPVKGFVIAGKPSSSILYTQLPAGAVNHMPLNRKQLDDCDIQKIYCWINQGAVNN